MKIKNKLMMATVMLLVSAIMLSTASFAWFSISTTPEITLTTNVVANENLEIALDNGGVPSASEVGDHGDNTTWGNIINMGNDPIGQLKPVELLAANQAEDTDNGVPAINAGNVAYPVYGNDGRIQHLAALVADDTAVGVVPYAIPDTNGDYVEGSDTWAIRLNFWLRTNVVGTVTLDQVLAEDVEVHDAVKIAVAVGTGNNFAADFADTVYNGSLSDFATAAATTPVEIFEATASANLNTAIPVSILIYLDGNDVTNADVAEAIAVALNLMFSNDGIESNGMSPD